MKTYIFLLGIVLFLASCDKNKKEDFNRAIMLENYADNIILSNINDFVSAMNSLESSAISFTSNPNLSNLSLLKSSYINASIANQSIKILNFGPVEDAQYTNNANIYPCDTALINGLIAAGSYDLTNASNNAANGFPAIDFLLYQTDDVAIVNLFSSDENALNRKDYLLGIIELLKSKANTINANWTSTYATTFKNSTGTDVGSSTGLLYNAFISDVELLKNAKIGIPSGQQTGGLTYPSYFEGYYGNHSKELAIASCDALKEIFTGGSGIGLDDYVRHVEGDDVSESMADMVMNQFDLCKAKLNGLNTPFSSFVESEFSEFNACYIEIKKLVTYLKTDVSSLLGILITFQDNDGD